MIPLHSETEYHSTAFKQMQIKTIFCFICGKQPDFWRDIPLPHNNEGREPDPNTRQNIYQHIQLIHPNLLYDNDLLNILL